MCQLIFQHVESAILCMPQEKGTLFFVSSFSGVAMLLKSFTKPMGKDWCRLLPGLVLFSLVAPPLQPGVVGAYPVYGTWFPSRLLLEGTRPYLDFFAITGSPWYKTPTVAPEPSVEQVVGAVHSMGGRIGTRMSLWVSPWDSLVRPYS
jgi:hypothetical protein